MANIFDNGWFAAVFGRVTDEQGSKRAAAPANGVHQSSGGSAGAGFDFVVHRGKDAGVVKAFAGAEEGHGPEEGGLIGGLADEIDESGAGEEAGSLDHDACVN